MWRIKTDWVVEPAVPEPVRGDYAIVAAEHVRAQEPLLYAGFGFGAPFAVLMGAGLPTVLRVGLPVTIVLACLLGILLRRQSPTTEHGALRSLVISIMVVGGIIALGSIWAILSWKTASEATRFGYPFFMTLGVVVTAYAFAKVRRLAMACLLVGFVPIATAVLIEGNIVEKTCALGMLVAAVFLFVMASNNRRFLVELLENRQRLRALSRLDSLTDLPNRRALLEDANRIGLHAAEVRVVLIDLDCFKAINDTHGHDMGDRVLCEVARIIEVFTPRGVCAARIGGEEFALVGSAEDLSELSGLRLLTTLREAGMPHGDRVTASIGMASGPLQTTSDWQVLYSRADKALYEAKAEGRDRAVIDACGSSRELSPELLASRGSKAA